MTQFTPISILLFAGSIQGITLAVTIFFRKKGGKTANQLLALFIFLMAISVLLHTLGHADLLTLLPEHHLIITALIFAHSPILYLYLLLLSGKRKRLNKIDFVHFAPTTAVFIILFSATYISVLKSVQHAIKLSFEVMAFFHYLAYMIVILLEVRNHIERIKQKYSSIDKINLKWIGLLVGLNIFTWILGGIIDVTMPKEEMLWDIVWAFVSIYMYLIGYFAFNQLPIMHDELITEDSEKKYRNSTLKDREANAILEQLNHIMNTQKAYLTENLTLPALASELSISVHHLSQVINMNFNMNFYEYINRQRIDEAKRMLACNEKDVSVTEVCFSAGFNSLSSFNSAFKKYTGITPSQFKNNSN